MVRRGVYGRARADGIAQRVHECLALVGLAEKVGVHAASAAPAGTLIG